MNAQDFREKYRPKFFSEVVGNKRVIKILKNMVKLGWFPNGILIFGPVGTAKTTLAQIFLKALHCQNFLEDVCGHCEECLRFEILFSSTCQWPYIFDCTGITEKVLKELFQNTFFPLPIKGRQVYILDEFHRTKPSLQENFLKPLETGEGRLFIFCLIDPKTISQAFRQRVMRLQTKRPEVDEIVTWLRGICDREGVSIKDQNALKQVPLSADRLPRESLSLLEKIVFLGEPLTTSLVKEIAQDNQESHDHGSQYTLDD